MVDWIISQLCTKCMTKGLKSAYRSHCPRFKKSIASWATAGLLLSYLHACWFRVSIKTQRSYSSVDCSRRDQDSSARNWTRRDQLYRPALKIIHFRRLTALYRPNCRRAVFICLAVWSARVANPSRYWGQRLSLAYLCVNPCSRVTFLLGKSLANIDKLKLTKRNKLHFAPAPNKYIELDLRLTMR